MMQNAEISGKMDETANPRGCKLEIGKKEHSGISRLFLETHSRMPSLQESSGIIFSTDECQKIFAGTEGSLLASLANLFYVILPSFLTFVCFFTLLILFFAFVHFLDRFLSVSSVRDFIFETGSVRQKFNSNQRI